MAGVNGVNGIQFGQATGVKQAQVQDNKMGTIKFNFDRNPEKMMSALNFVTDMAQAGNGVYTPATKGFLGMGAQEATITLNF